MSLTWGARAAAGDPPSEAPPERIDRGVVGYRAFRWQDADAPRLHSVYRDHQWAPGLNQTAGCRVADASHEVPGWACSCGYHAMLDWEDARRLDWGNNILAAVLGTGRIVLHERGFRSSGMRIIALRRPERAWFDVSIMSRRTLDMPALLAHYGVPILDGDRYFLAYASEWEGWDGVHR